VVRKVAKAWEEAPEALAACPLGEKEDFIRSLERKASIKRLK
jgi:hypothetical protein